MVLLCPAFHIVDHLSRLLGQEAFHSWEMTGTHPLGYGPQGADTRVGWAFIQDTRRLPPRPPMLHPTLIIHGSGDDIIPIAESENAVRQANSPSMHLCAVDDGHDLVDSLPLITEACRVWLLEDCPPDELPAALAA